MSDLLPAGLVRRNDARGSGSDRRSTAESRGVESQFGARAPSPTSTRGGQEGHESQDSGAYCDRGRAGPASTPAPAAAQAPPARERHGSAQHVHDAAGRHALALARRGRRARAREQRRHRGRALQPRAERRGRARRRGLLRPVPVATLTKSSTDTKGTNVFTGGATVNTKTGLWNFGVQQAIQTGGNLSVGFNNNKRDTNNAFSTFNPFYNSSLSFNLTQPLLKNFGSTARACSSSSPRRTARSPTCSSGRPSSTPWRRSRATTTS